MSKKGKKIVTADGQVDLDHYVWDEALFADILVKKNRLDTEIAMDISRFLRQSIEELEVRTITQSIVDALLKEKLTELGISKASKIRIVKTLFKKNGLVISDNAKTVLERRYLKKGPNGEIVETPEMMFRRVARHIAMADERYGDDCDVKRTEQVFYDMNEFEAHPPEYWTLIIAKQRK